MHNYPRNQPSISTVTGCGSGNLILPLSWLFPSLNFVAVDINPTSIQRLKGRLRGARARCSVAGGNNVETRKEMERSTRKTETGHVENVRTWVGGIEHFQEINKFAVGYRSRCPIPCMSQLQPSVVVLVYVEVGRR